MCSLQGHPAPLTDVARRRNGNKCFVDGVQSFQNIPHFSTELQRKLLGKWLSPLLYQFCLKPLLLGLILQELPSSLQLIPLYQGQFLQPLFCVSIHLFFSQNCLWKNPCFLSVVYIFVSLFCPFVYFMLSMPLRFSAMNPPEAFTLLHVELSIGAILCSAQWNKDGEWKIRVLSASGCTVHTCGPAVRDRNGIWFFFLLRDQGEEGVLPLLYISL